MAGKRWSSGFSFLFDVAFGDPGQERCISPADFHHSILVGHDAEAVLVVPPTTELEADLGDSGLGDVQDMHIGQSD